MFNRCAATEDLNRYTLGQSDMTELEIQAEEVHRLESVDESFLNSEDDYTIEAFGDSGEAWRSLAEINPIDAAGNEVFDADKLTNKQLLEIAQAALNFTKDIYYKVEQRY